MKHPLAEVFGFPITNFSEDAKRFRKNKLCPFNNKVPSCTKDKANNPLGVCSLYHNDHPVITCPIRFRELWTIAEKAAIFFFGEDTPWTSIAEVTLYDSSGKSAGNIDFVLVSYDLNGKILDFGSLEIQAVYISGNVRAPFEYYLEKPSARKNFSWLGKPNYPKPDFLSSSRKRLIPQILYKGGILRSWGKKQAVALQKNFFDTLPQLPAAEKEKADIIWFIYDLKYNKDLGKYQLAYIDTVYTEFTPALDKIVTPLPGPVEDFIEILQHRLDERLEGNPPDNYCITDSTLS